MSDPASRPDGDTVLASIRRLVLTDHGDTPDTQPPAPSGPLILTEALRVDTAQPEASERPVAGQDPFDPVGTDEDALDDAGAALDWQDTADSPGASETQRDLPDDLPGDPATSSLTDAVVDEDFLRDIVSEIVREELQGDMGQRITRNVRKLVRREIHRAMASRDLDD